LISESVSATSANRGASRLDIGGAGLLRVLRRHWPLVAVLALVTAVYLPTLDHYFHGDDFLALIDLATKQPWPFFRDVLTFQDSNFFWRPLGELYNLALYSIFGLDHVAFHVGSIVVFLATLVLVYVFCLNAGLGRGVAIGAVLILGLFPNHPLNVAWTTAVPRVIGVMFLMLSLVLLQTALRTRSPRFEVLAVVAFALACLADETLAPLGPVPVLYALAMDRREGWLRRSALRAAGFGAIAVSIVAIQVLLPPSAARMESVTLGQHMLKNYWGLLSKLVLPVPDGIGVVDVALSQWIAGLIAGVVGVLLLALGERRVRFLVLWTALGLVPFSTWAIGIVPARYVYLGAVPFSILFAWFIVAVWQTVINAQAWEVISRRRAVRPAFVALAIVLLTSGIVLSIHETHSRHLAFGRETEKYRILAVRLPEALPHVPPGATIVVYDGIWEMQALWPDAVVQTIYGDRTLRLLNVPPEHEGTSWPRLGIRDKPVTYRGEKRGFYAPRHRSLLDNTVPVPTQ
jgi:hypothetical protein